jgi:hypothetical protein
MELIAGYVEAFHLSAAAAHRVVEAALSEAREELMGAMWRHYPAAARRILAGMRPAVDDAGSPR